jgi:hypothetical protein
MAIYKVVGKPVPAIVAVLEDALAEAKSGQTQALAIIAGYYDSGGMFVASTVSAAGPGMKTDPVVGALARLQYRIMSGT